MKRKKKIIVYGLGKMYRRTESYLENKFDIVGYSDSREVGTDKKIIPPEDISQYDYDYICVTSTKYFDEMKENLINKHGGGHSKQNYIALRCIG